MMETSTHQDCRNIKKKRASSRRRQEILNKFSENSAADEYAYAVYILHKETSISYTEIFGEETKYTETVEESRGPFLDFLLGQKQKKVERVGRTPGMRAQTLQTYIDLMQEHQERKDRERNRNSLRNSMQGKMGG